MCICTNGKKGGKSKLESARVSRREGREKEGKGGKWGIPFCFLILKRGSKEKERRKEGRKDGWMDGSIVMHAICL